MPRLRVSGDEEDAVDLVGPDGRVTTSKFILTYSTPILLEKGLTELIPQLSTPGSLTLYFSKEMVVPPLKIKFMITRCARM